MQYLRDQFTLPVGSEKITQRQWDFAFLPKEKFLKKYGEDAKEYRSDSDKK